jgi:acyl carrier protein
MSNLVQEIKELIIESLDLEELSPADIETDEPLFEDGLGLDSIDALELGMALQAKFGVKINAEDENTREYFRSVASLTRFVTDNQTP